ncbi:MAG: CoA pyrophosphatase [Leptospiraceae bacterium]|nr:CoA pyrophosphatase [Leptospiraceae bacterium]MCP5513165.1 CoA pyrophosphatase [Leptospiraceae bacterium]
MKLDFDKLMLESDSEEPTFRIRPGVRASSVIIPIFKNSNGGHSVILTKRSEELKHHPGQISFPGGTLSENETFLGAGIREFEEELGVPGSDLDPISDFGYFDTSTGFVIIPFIAYYKGDFQFKPNPSEVDKVIIFDLEMFNEKPFYAMESKRVQGKYVYYLQLEDDLLWGATAMILVSLLRKLSNFDREPIRVRSNLSGPPFFNPLDYESGKDSL